MPSRLMIPEEAREHIAVQGYERFEFGEFVKDGFLIYTLHPEAARKVSKSAGRPLNLAMIGGIVKTTEFSPDIVVIGSPEYKGNLWDVLSEGHVDYYALMNDGTLRFGPQRPSKKRLFLVYSRNAFYAPL